LYGNTALIGAYNDDDEGLNSGSVYVFTRPSADGTFTYHSKIYASSPGSADLFGSSVSLYGDTALIGAPNHASSGLTTSGTVYVFKHSSTSGLFTQHSQLYANDADESDVFGCSVSLYGDTALIGACGDDGYDDGNVLVQDSGSVYVFTLSITSGTFTQHSQLYAGDAATNDNFGCSVSLYGNTALIGATNTDNNFQDSGSVYVFTRPSADGTFTQQSQLYANDATASDNFGVSVSLHGNTALVGAWFDDGSDESKSGSGSVYAFMRSTTDGTFTEQFKLYASDAAENDFFGASVSLYGDTVLIGARDDDGLDTTNGFTTTTGPSNSGSVYVFRDLSGLPSGTYYINVNGVPTQIYCDLETAGGGWMSFASAPASGNWFSGDSGQNSWLSLSYSYGEYSATGEVGDYWRDYSGQDVTDIMFKTGDGEYWIVFKLEDIAYPQNTNGNENREGIFDFVASSGNFQGDNEENTKGYYLFRESSMEDPWINAGDDHAVGNNYMFWGENSIHWHREFKNAHGGILAFVR
jgi:hypothetical protein